MTQIIPANLPTEAEQKALGHQIETQYAKATSGLVENIALGGLIEQARDIVSTCGHDRSRGGGRDTEGEGLKGWLAEHAPSVTRSTAYRCLELTKGVREELGIGKNADLYELLKGAKPTDKEVAQREKITAFVAGKSQRTLLIGFGKIDGERGGARNKRTKKPTPEEIRAAYLEDAKQRSVSVFSGLHELDDRWQVLSDDELRQAVKDAKEFTKRAEKYLELPKARRPEFNVEKYQEKKS